MYPVKVSDKHSKSTAQKLPQEATKALIERWEDDLTIAEQLPIIFKNGARLDEYLGNCGMCNTKVPLGDFRGTITFPIPSVAVIEATAGCIKCNAITRYTHRVRDDLSLQWQEADGSWATAKMQAKGVRNKLKLWYQKLKR